VATPEGRTRRDADQRLHAVLQPAARLERKGWAVQVDTDPQILHTLWTALSARGYQVISGTDGATALRVVLELGLPDIDGPAVTNRSDALFEC
jgi:hypothetical protein